MLTQKAFQILHLLVKNAGQLVKKETLIREIWQDSFIEDSNITQQIYILRKTLGNDKNGKPLIETLPKRGYCFIGEVKKVEDEAEVISSSELPVVENAEDSTQKSYFWQYGLVGLTVIAVFGAILFFQLRKVPTENAAINSIAVLPFKNINQDDSKLGFGLADAVITNLSKQQKIPVRSMSAVFQYADKEAFDPIEAGKNLGVDSVLEGTVQREGEQVRVSLRLIKISDGSTLWAETFNEKFSNIFTLQDSISAKVAQSLPLNLSGWEKPLIAQQPATAEASQFYQLGVYFSNIKTKDSLERAVSYFLKVIELDSNYAPAYAKLADSYNWLNEFGDVKTRDELLNKSEVASQKALSLDNTLAEAHIAIAFVQFVKYKDTEAGENSIKHAVKLDPYNAFARLHYGWQLLYQGDLEGGYQQTVLAQEYSPLSVHINLTHCSFLIFKREYPKALESCKKVAALQPSTPLINVQIANILFLLDRKDEAINLLKLESENVSERYSALGSLAYIYAKTGNKAEAEKLYSQLKENYESSNKYLDLTLVGFAIGKKDEALKNFEEMIKRAAIKPKYLNFDPFWEEILKHEDFKTLIERKSDKPS